MIIDETGRTTSLKVGTKKEHWEPRESRQQRRARERQEGKEQDREMRRKYRFRPSLYR